MSESPARPERPEGQSGSTAEKPRIFTGLRLVTLAAASVVVMTCLLYWVGGRNERSQTRRTTEAPAAGSARVDEPPPLSPPEVLGLAPELPATAEAFNAEVAETCERLVEDLPHRPEAHAVAAFIFNRHGQTAEASACWRKALEVNPRFASAYWGLGVVAVKKGEYQEAAKLLKETLALEPGHGQANSLLVEALLRQGQAEAALTTARQFVDRLPKSADSHYWLGRAYAELGKHQDSKESFDEAVRLAPTYTEAHYSLATVCARLGEQDQARVHREKFAELKEKDTQEDRQQTREYRDLAAQKEFAASYHLAAGKVYADFGEPRKAEAHWLRGAAIAPEIADCRQALVSFYVRRNRPASAVRQLDELVATAPKNPALWTQRGRLLAGLGRLEAAEASFRKAIKVAPDQVDAYAGVVELALHSGRPIPDAAALAEKAAELAPSAQAYLRLSAARSQSGDRPGAVAAAKQAVDLEPKNAVVHEAYEQILRSNR